MIPLKLIKTGDDSIAILLTLAKNCYLFQEIFPDINKTCSCLKAALVLPYKRKPNKNDVLNYRPITILNPIQDGFFHGCSRMKGRGQKGPLPKI